MLRTPLLLLALSSCSIFRASDADLRGGDQNPAADTLRIVVKIPAECYAGNYEVEVEGKIQGMFKPGEEVVYLSTRADGHYVTVRRKLRSWRQELRPQSGQTEWAVKVPCDSLR